MGCGMFLANFVPHFFNGISGNPFPTPFANPPGKGLSSPFINVWWALFNGVVGFLLFKAGNVAAGDNLSLVSFFAGVGAMSSLLSIRFVHKHKA